MKGFLTYHEAEFARVHDLRYLLNLCQAIASEFEIMEAEIEELNEYTVEPRYPADLPIYYPLQEAQRAIELARYVLDFVQERFSSEIEGKR